MRIRLFLFIVFVASSLYALPPEPVSVTAWVKSDWPGLSLRLEGFIERAVKADRSLKWARPGIDPRAQVHVYLRHPVVVEEGYESFEVEYASAKALQPRYLLLSYEKQEGLSLKYHPEVYSSFFTDEMLHDIALRVVDNLRVYAGTATGPKLKAGRFVNRQYLNKKRALIIELIDPDASRAVIDAADPLRDMLIPDRKEKEKPPLPWVREVSGKPSELEPVPPHGLFVAGFRPYGVLAPAGILSLAQESNLDQSVTLEKGRFSFALDVGIHRIIDIETLPRHVSETRGRIYRYDTELKVGLGSDFEVGIRTGIGDIHGDWRYLQRNPLTDLTPEEHSETAPTDTWLTLKKSYPHREISPLPFGKAWLIEIKAPTGGKLLGTGSADAAVKFVIDRRWRNWMWSLNVGAFVPGPYTRLEGGGGYESLDLKAVPTGAVGIAAHFGHRFSFGLSLHAAENTAKDTLTLATFEEPITNAALRLGWEGDNHRYTLTGATPISDSAAESFFSVGWEIIPPN